MTGRRLFFCQMENRLKSVPKKLLIFRINSGIFKKFFIEKYDLLCYTKKARLTVRKVDKSEHFSNQDTESEGKA